ncbi:MAG: hypothetical protein M3680_26130, partial [Myxococcota bacterium]|nr:hypothetical protein [Myxococcota bacterium]
MQILKGTYPMRSSLAHLSPSLFALAAVAGCGDNSNNGNRPDAATNPDASPSSQVCAADNGGITLPAGFCASVFADGLGRARHMAVTPSGDIFVIIDP